MPILYRLIVLVAILATAFFIFRKLMRTGFARRLFNMQEQKDTTALQGEEQRLKDALENRKQDLLRKQRELYNELEKHDS
jgi:uncharacterized protein HemX